jgi:hypothetical protein
MKSLIDASKHANYRQGFALLQILAGRGFIFLPLKIKFNLLVEMLFY